MDSWEIKRPGGRWRHGSHQLSLFLECTGNTILRQGAAHFRSLFWPLRSERLEGFTKSSLLFLSYLLWTSQMSLIVVILRLNKWLFRLIQCLMMSTTFVVNSGWVVSRWIGILEELREILIMWKKHTRLALIWLLSRLNNDTFYLSFWANTKEQLRRILQTSLLLVYREATIAINKFTKQVTNSSARSQYIRSLISFTNFLLLFYILITTTLLALLSNLSVSKCQSSWTFEIIISRSTELRWFHATVGTCLNILEYFHIFFS